LRFYGGGMLGGRGRFCGSGRLGRRHGRIERGFLGRGALGRRDVRAGGKRIIDVTHSVYIVAYR
jgi:hypothetical protein